VVQAYRQYPNDFNNAQPWHVVMLTGVFCLALSAALWYARQRMMKSHSKWRAVNEILCVASLDALSLLNLFGLAGGY
jgi:uncharacterized membrane protein